MRVFEAECRLRGLIASPSKTELLYGQRARDSDADEARQSAGYLFESRQYAPARRALRGMFARALQDEGHINVRHAKFALWRLTLLREAAVLNRVLERLDDLAPVASVAGAYLGGVIQRPRTVAGLTSYVTSADLTQTPFLTAFLFAAMLQHPERLPREWNGEARAIAVDRNQPRYLRDIAFSVMAKSLQAVDLAWLRRELLAEDDDMSARAMAVALARVGSLERPLALRIAARSDLLRRAVTYLQDTRRLPSLVHNRAAVPIP